MTTRQNSTKRLAIWGFGLSIPAAVVVGLLMAAVRPATTPATPRQQVVPVEVVVIQPVTEYEDRRHYTGTLESTRSSELGFERAGRLVQVYVDEGDEVYQGQRLAQLDERHLKARREQLQAQRDQAVALLDEYLAGPRKQTIAAARGDVADMESQYQHADASHRRNVDLQKKKVISKEDFDASAFGVRSAKARLDSAQKKLDELLAGTRKERIAAQRAAVSQLNAALADLAIDIDDTHLTAPYPGRVAKRHVDEGTIISPQTTVIRLVEHAALEARIGLPVAIATTVRSGMKHEVLIGGKSYPAKVKTVLPELDLTTRTRIVVLTLESESAELLVPGEIARIEIAEHVPARGYWLPTSALSRGRRGLWSVLAVAEDQDSGMETAEQRDVEILHTAGERVFVRGTLRSGDRVITGGTHRIVSGQAVRSLAIASAHLPAS